MPRRLKDIARRNLAAAAGIAEIYFLAGELLDRLDARVGAHDDVHFLIEQFRDVDDLVVDIADFVGLAKFVENDRLGDPQIDPLKEADVADILPAAFADHRQDPEVVTVVENGGQIVGDIQIGAVRIAGHDRNRVGIQTFTDST